MRPGHYCGYTVIISLLNVFLDENEENQPSPFKTPSPCKKKKDIDSFQLRGETPVRASLAAKLATARLEDDIEKGSSCLTRII